MKGVSWGTGGGAFALSFLQVRREERAGGSTRMAVGFCGRRRVGMEDEGYEKGGGCGCSIA